MAISTKIKDVQVKVGNTIKVKHQFLVAGKPQSQSFKGVIISIKGRGIGQTFTVRKISADSIGVEKIWPVHSPNLLKITLVKSGQARRAKLYYLRQRIGRSALRVQQEKIKSRPKTATKKRATPIKKVIKLGEGPVAQR